MEVIELDFNNDTFTLKTSSKTFEYNYVIIASGTKPKSPHNINLDDVVLDKVYFEIKDLKNIINKKVFIIGAGDIALDYAVTLGKDNKVIILNRSSKIKANPELIDQVMHHKNIEYMDQVQIRTVSINETGLNLNAEYNEEEKQFHTDYLVIAIGRLPQKDFYAPGLMEREHLMIESNRLFLIGDVCNGNFRQAAIASGDLLQDRS